MKCKYGLCINNERELVLMPACNGNYPIIRIMPNKLVIVLPSKEIEIPISHEVHRQILDALKQID